MAQTAKKRTVKRLTVIYHPSLWSVARAQSIEPQVSVSHLSDAVLTYTMMMMVNASHAFVLPLSDSYPSLFAVVTFLTYIQIENI
jgi:hypothetical protein